MATGGEDKDLIMFDPPLWRQRRGLVNQVLRKHQVTSVFDFGCGEGALLSFLVQPFEDGPIVRLAGIDICSEILKSTSKNCSPWDHDHEFLRLTPLTVDLYQGSIDVADERLCGYEAVVCMEVIEHVDPPVLEKFFEVVLGAYKPKILIVTTPNVEFNIYFPQLKYGTPEAILRIDDHRFEWTRKEFQEWALSGADKYNYSVEFSGVGRLKDSDPAVGFATQIAIFLDLEPGAAPMASNFGAYQLIEHIIFPHYDEPEKSHSEIIEDIDYFMKFLCNHITEDEQDSSSEKDKVDNNLKKDHVLIDDLWNIHRIHQICKSKEKLCEVLATCADFTLVNNEWVQVHKKYELEQPVQEDMNSPFTNDDAILSEGSNTDTESWQDKKSRFISNTTSQEDNYGWEYWDKSDNTLSPLSTEEDSQWKTEDEIIDSQWKTEDEIIDSQWKNIGIGIEENLESIEWT
ncbi:hypothetical protein G9A89_003323 [Geosiphon pyriformis]|nr:hypothetical protein G9A89_003323 [Geosiphon pyriformis]